MTHSALTIKVVRVVDQSAAVMCVCDVWNLCWCKLADLQPSHMHAVPSAEPTAAYFTGAPARRCQDRLCTERAALYSPTPKSVEHKPSSEAYIRPLESDQLSLDQPTVDLIYSAVCARLTRHFSTCFTDLVLDRELKLLLAGENVSYVLADDT